MTTILRRHFLALACVSTLASASGARGEPVDLPKMLPGEFIYENDFDHPCAVLRIGDLLVFRNERGHCAWGTLTSPTRVEAGPGRGWGKVGGTISADGNVIRWDNNVTWRRIKHRNLWIYKDDFDHLCETLEVGDALAFRNERGHWTWGTLTSPTRVEAGPGEGWGRVGGDVTNRGTAIRWDNHTTWRRVPRLDP
jgi:hypothetical protein